MTCHKRMFAACIACCLLAGHVIPPVASAAPKPKVTNEEDDEKLLQEMLNAKVRIVILGSGKDYNKLEKQAKAISKRAKVPFSMEGMTYDKKKGLICVDDEVWAGFYIFRRDSTRMIKGKESHYISIEKSEAYTGLKEGFYLIVADISFSERDAAKTVKQYKPIVPDVYAPRTTVYMGCLH